MKALIVGLGSIGQRHLSNLRLLEPDADITVWRRHAKPQEGATGRPADRVVYQLDKALQAKPELALISNPSSLHIETGLALARQGIHLFIEKPLSNRLDNIGELLNICSQRALKLTVGYNLRFCKSLQTVQQALQKGRIGRLLSVRAQVGQFLPDWRSGEDYQNSVSARRDLGGGVVLELSHELDYLYWLVGEVNTVSAQLAHLSDLDIDVEDTAEITIKFKNGVIGNVHLDMVQRDPIRMCRFTGSEGSLVWNGISNQVQLFSPVTADWSDLYPAGPIDRNEMYLAELRHFLDCVKDNKEPIVSGADGLHVLKIAMAAKESSEYQKVIEL